MYKILEALLSLVKVNSHRVKTLSEGPFSRVVAHIRIEIAPMNNDVKNIRT